MTMRKYARHLNSDGETIVQVNGVGICMQTIGDPYDPPILLIHGAGASLKGWPDCFVNGLADNSRFVIRYDHRDTGRSIGYPPGAPGYDLYDLVDDAVGLLDVLDLPAAHIIGISMGGGIAPIMAVNYPEHVESLTLMATSPGGNDLPPMSQEFIDFISGTNEPDWSDSEAVAEHVLGMMRVVAGGPGSLDEAAVREMLVQDIERSTVNVQSSQVNHYQIEHGEPVRERLGEISAPTLIIHGTDDPIFQIGHAVALANAIPGARLVVLDSVGHVIPWQAADRIVTEIVEHTAGVSLGSDGK